MFAENRNMGRLTGKSAFVTAAGQGIGRASALALADEGAKVFATDLNGDLLADLPEISKNIEVSILDARDANAISTMAGEIGPVDILFNCAGYVHHGTILEATDGEWDFAFDLNVKSMYHTIRAFLPAMLENGGGSIINMASAASSIKGAPNRFIYSTTKAAVIGLTKSVAADFITKGIRCNAICPGTVQSPSLEDRIKAQGDYDKAKAAFVARQPMGRLGTTEEIAGLVVYLASDDAAFTTGTTHLIDGGWSL